jgi:hypothetical protein
MIHLKKLFTVLVLIHPLLISALGYGQSLPKKEMESAVHKMADLIDKNYVFPEKGKKMALYLVDEYKKGKLSSARTWKEFDSLSTRILQTFSHDGHMYVRYDPKTVKDLSAIKEVPEKGNFSYDPFYYGPEAVENNFGFREVKVLEGNMGYIKLNEINISEKSLPVLYAAMNFVSNTKALIIDLQNNGGGGNAVGNVFESYFLPKETALLEFRTRNGEAQVSKTVAWLTEKKYDKPLFILINSGTASAAEAFTFALQTHKRATVVGQPSAGGAHMNSWYPVNEHIFISVSTGAPTLPGTEISWEQKGVQPDAKVSPGEEIAYIKSLLEKK